MRVGWVGVLGALAGCGGDGTTDDTREGVEICDDGVDNNDNGKVDCEDTAYCGGLQCVTTPTGDDDDDDTNLPDVEVDYAGAPISFTFTPQAGGCEQQIQSFTVINRAEADAATVSASCDLIGGEVVALAWTFDGVSPARPFVTDEPLGPASQVDLELFFGCTLDREFTTTCRVEIQGLELIDRAEFQVSGAPI